MKIAIVGYGKMGHMIADVARSAGHEIVTTVDTYAYDAKVIIPAGDKSALGNAILESGAEGIIEFTSPQAVLDNIRALLPLKLPLVVGSTGWDAEKDGISELARTCGGTIMHSANFSIGVNLFYKIVEQAALLVSNFDEYDVALWEMHHNQKADSPSGTALEIANRVLSGNHKKTEIVSGAFHEKPKDFQLHVSSTRCGSVPGTHTVFFDSEPDSIELKHTARSRKGFAMGAVHALENLKRLLDAGTLQPGHLYGMNDVFPEMF